MVSCSNYAYGINVLSWNVFLKDYSEVDSGTTIAADLIKRPKVALPMISGHILGVIGFVVGLAGIIRKSDRSILVFVASVIGFFIVLWWFSELYQFLV